MSTSRRRRPGIVAKLMLLSLVLLTIPWLAQRYFRELEAFVLAGQRSALELAAQAVATLLQGRDELFEASGGLPIDLSDAHRCSPLPLAAPVQLDGNGRDWSLLGEHGCRFGREHLLAGDASPEAFAFDLTLGQRAGHLYALFEVWDDVVVERHLRFRNLDASDHLRLTLPDADGVIRRFVLTPEDAGAMTAYEVGDDFRYALGDGLPETRIRGHWSETPRGYAVEMRLPLSLIPRREIGFAVADVDRLAGPVRNVVGTFPPGEAERLELVLLDTHEIREVMQSQATNLPGAKITVIDAQERVRTEVGADVGLIERAPRERLLRTALVDAAPPPAFSGERITAASAPIRSGDRVIGAILIEQSNLEILGMQRDALERALAAILVACVGVAAVLWLFAGRLAWRIHRLRDDAAGAIDEAGRVRRASLAAGRDAGDEIGDLSRAISGLLGRLSRYTGFLEEIPRTLRHELSNPLNSLSTSLQNLVAEQPDLEKNKYLNSAERGVARIGAIVESLTDAANLEQALRDDERERVDLARLLPQYVENVAAACPERRFRYIGSDDAVVISASGFRIEQMLDKLLDNAVEFSPDGGAIAVSLDCVDEAARVRVSNDGEPISTEIRERIFDSMVSRRPAGERAHLGIGLYVVRLILDHLGGSVVAIPRRDPPGTTFELTIPLDR